MRAHADSVNMIYTLSEYTSTRSYSDLSAGRTPDKTLTAHTHMNTLINTHPSKTHLTTHTYTYTYT